MLTHKQCLTALDLVLAANMHYMHKVGHLITGQLCTFYHSYQTLIIKTLVVIMISSRNNPYNLQAIEHACVLLPGNHCTEKKIP